MNIQNPTWIYNQLTAQQSGIKATVDGHEKDIPIDWTNRHYIAVMELVNAGELTISEPE